MSGHSQRGKGKPVSRVRSQKMQSSGANFAKGCHGQAGGNQGDEELGIFANMEMAYALGRYVIGNIVEVTTNENEKLLGVVKAISQDGDVGLVHAYSPQKGKNGRVSVDAMLVNYSNWRMLRIQNVRPNDCLLDEIKIDSEIANECDLPVANATDKQLVPFFDSSEPIKDCLLDQGGFPADEMFKTNKELFSVRTTFNPDLREYTTPVDRTAPNYQETEARCAKLAQDIEQSESTLTNMENALENDDDEEEKYSAVSRSAKDHPGNTARLSIRSSRSAHDRPSSRLEVVNVSRQLANVSVHSKGVTNVSSETNQPVVEANSAKSPVPSAPIQDTLNKAPSQPDLSEKPSAVEVTETVKPKVTSESSEPPPSSVVTSVTEEKVKKSTLDPNAPEFKPLSLQYATAHPPVVPQQSVPGVTYATHAPQNSLNPAPTIQLPMQPMSAFVAGAQTPLYVPSSVSYASQAGQLQQLMSGVVSASIPSNIQHVRGGSLPPNLQQPPFNSPVNSGANILMQHPQQPGLSVAQMITSQPVIVAGPNPGRFSGPPSSMSLTRQRSNESSAGQQSSLYCPSQPSVSIPAFQPSVYQFSQPGTIPFLVPPTNGFAFSPCRRTWDTHIFSVDGQWCAVAPSLRSAGLSPSHDAAYAAGSLADADYAE
ncbi:unnamed protein product [Calicophoron daubneyi]|uniref:LsmAD domain-containing protein n=1 Tax=Calicophoron daubneyi TaxID=300641 RepID=A0AAV2TKY7_CALDB